MNFTIIGLKALELAKVTSLLNSFVPGDLLAYGCTAELISTLAIPPVTTPYTDASFTEAMALSELISGMLATDCKFGVTYYGKFCMAKTAADLLPEVENLDFTTGSEIYVTIAE